jgi:predicted secreted protein
MRELLLALGLFMMLGGLIAGCGSPGVSDGKITIEVEPTETVSTVVGEEFTITRNFDLNSGFIWREEYDESELELLENAVDSVRNEAGEVRLLHIFRFKALKKGQTVIRLTLTRSQMGGSAVSQQDIIAVDIK